MANRFCNLVGTEKIKDSYANINVGFDGVQDDVNVLGVNVAKAPWLADPTGVQDSGARINAAISYAFDNQIYKVFIPAGTYTLEEPVVPLNDIWIQGVGRTSFLRIKNNTDISAIYTPNPIYNARISHLTIDGNKQNNTFPTRGDGMNVHISSCVIEHCRFINIYNNAMRINDDGSIYEGLGYLNRIQHNEIEDAYVGIRWSWRCTDSWCTNNNIGSVYANMYIQGGSCRFFNNHLNGEPEHNAIFEGGNTIVFSNNIAENAKKHAIYAPSLGFDDATRNLVIANNIIRVSSKEAPNTYDLVHLEGRSSTKATGIVIASNMIISDTSSPRHAVHLENVQDSVVIGNSFLGGYVTIPVQQVSSTNIQVTANIVPG